VPRQNRVTPLGELVAIPERGTMMGNRGVLHDPEGRIVRPWQVRRWIICVLEFRGRHRTVMAPNRYTELFFLDEATALAAGHRPCFECRRARFLAFRDAWAAGNCEAAQSETIRAGMIDDRLHAERVGPMRTKRTFTANLDDLPDGAFVMLEGSRDACHLVLDDTLLAWTPSGYSARLPRPAGAVVSVLTPRSIVAALRAGYQPEIHPTAFAPGRRT
jgi:hypothetical protein